MPGNHGHGGGHHGHGGGRRHRGRDRGWNWGNQFFTYPFYYVYLPVVDYIDPYYYDPYYRYRYLRRY